MPTHCTHFVISLHGCHRFQLCCALILALFTGEATAQNSIYQEQYKLIRAPNAVAGIGPDLFGDRVNLSNGGLEFVQTDVSLPGNNSLPVSIGRRFVAGQGNTEWADRAFGRWDLDIPHLHGVFSNKDGWVAKSSPIGARCSNFGAPRDAVGTNGASVWSPSQFWHGNFLYVPGVGDQQMLVRASTYVQAPGPVQLYPVVTVNFWSISCLPSLANDSSVNKSMGEGFLATSPDGTKYQFDWMVSYRASTLAGSDPGGAAVAPSPDETAPLSKTTTAVPTPDVIVQPALARKEVWILPTLVTDRFGNWVRYRYDPAVPQNLTRIESSDGRVIDLTYVPGTNRIYTVSDGTRTWTYAYATDTLVDLASVTLPDGSAWQFRGTDKLYRRPGYGLPVNCDDPVPIDATPYIGTMVHPSGATGSFTLKGTVHGRSDVPFACDQGTDYVPSIPRYYYTQALINKTISGPGLPTMTWAYDYGAVNSS